MPHLQQRNGAGRSNGTQLRYAFPVDNKRIKTSQGKL